MYMEVPASVSDITGRFGLEGMLPLPLTRSWCGACASNVWCMCIKRLVHVHQTYGACASNVWCMCIIRSVHVHQTFGELGLH